MKEQVKQVKTYARGTGSPVEFADQEIKISISNVEDWISTPLNSNVVKLLHNYNS